MRVKLAFVAITCAVMGVVACQPGTTPTPDPCKAASRLPAYDVTQSDGSKVHVPAGRVLVQEDGSNQACRAYIRQWAAEN
jgi:hypothetical protein